LITKLSGKLRLVALAIAFATSTAAWAQSESDFVAAFAGKWVVFDQDFSAGGKKCELSLEKSKVGDRYGLQVANCGGELKGAAQWGIVENQLALLDGGGLVLVRLGGNQRRMTGTTTSDKPVVFDRAEGGGLGNLIQAAIKASGCYYLGFTDKCAPESALADPLKAAPTGDKKIKILVNLNVRGEARDDANVVGVAPQNSCIAVDTCLTASDGVWCRAQFGPKVGWIRKIALRQNRWPVITFLNSCGGDK
jgi:hypothetical protein